MDEIEEILLDQGQIIPALKLTHGNANVRKYLQAAQNSDDPLLFHSTFHYFTSKPQHAAAFKKGNSSTFKLLAEMCYFELLVDLNYLVAFELFLIHLGKNLCYI